jgi:hypothetical protein
MRLVFGNSQMLTSSPPSLPDVIDFVASCYFLAGLSLQNAIVGQGALSDIRKDHTSEELSMKEKVAAIYALGAGSAIANGFVFGAQSVASVSSRIGNQTVCKMERQKSR